MSKIERAANEAVFHRQLPTSRAVEFVVSEAGCKPGEAERMIRQIVVAYKQR